MRGAGANHGDQPLRDHARGGLARSLFSRIGIGLEARIKRDHRCREQHRANRQREEHFNEAQSITSH